MKEQDKDRLKDFVQEHNNEFNLETPPALDFSHLGKETVQKEGPKMIPISWLYRAAAIFVLLLTLGAFWILSSNNTNQYDVVAEEKMDKEESDFNLSELSPEMAELEDYYSNELSSKQKELESLGYGDAIQEELAILDEEFNALKMELGENVDNHLIVNEMVKNYKLKLDLLESVLNDLQENYNDKNLTNLDNDENYTIYY
ncbi:MAG: hypothetical protein H6600_06055 [Flavobacteriales bacterium]|nr:hypothetical protein [Flavobacteriales bacterium]MCB9198006.1 hypothetical protein [Flavobacteriales bacterium]